MLAVARTARSPARERYGDSRDLHHVRPPGSTVTNPVGITPAGAIAGYYFDASDLSHSFLRAPGGTLTPFDPPGATCSVSTQNTCSVVSGINPAGVITGYYTDANFVNHGFLRDRSGAITAFDPPGVCCGNFTFPTGINPDGAITGAYFGFFGAEFGVHGFLRASDGTFTIFDAPGTGSAVDTVPVGINPDGTITGWYISPDFAFHGFVRARNGAFTTFDPFGSIQTNPSGINPEGAITGFYFDSSFIEHGFLRAPDGALTTFDPLGPDTLATVALGINPAGAITGWDLSLDFTIEHGFLRAPDGTVTSFDVPGSFYTHGSAINPAGAITGFYCDATTCHGFLRSR